MLARCTVAYGQFSRIYRCGGSVGIACKSAPIFPFHLSGYPEQAPNGWAKITVGGRLCQAPRHGPRARCLQRGAGATLPRKTTPGAPPPSAARPPPKRLYPVAQQRGVDGGFPAEGRGMHLAASQVRLCFGEAMSHVFVARFAPAPRSAKARFCRQKRVALTGGGLAALGGDSPKICLCRCVNHRFKLGNTLGKAFRNRLGIAEQILFR